MALANIACILAKLKEGPVLMIDWDLEAPGLHRFFGRRIVDGPTYMDSHTLEEMPGLIELFIKLKDYLIKTKSRTEDDIEKALEIFDFDQFILKTDIPSLYLIKAGKFDNNYPTKVNRFKWDIFYNKYPDIFKNLALCLSKKYKHILIDSRTGVTDISGITTMLMPNKLVAVFTPNRQSLTGVIDLIDNALDYRKQSNDLRPIIVFPLPSRIEASEPDLRKKWRHGDQDQDILGYQVEFEKVFRKGYDLANCSLEEYFNEVQIQHVPRYSYGEEIAALVEESQDRLSLSMSYKNFTEKIIGLEIPWIDKAKHVSFSIPRQIPPPPRDFKNRYEEIADILSSFQKGAIITGLRGMGGVGKTALALVLADRLKSQFPDGQIFIDMRGTSNNPELPPLTPDEAMAQVIRAYHPSDRLPESSNELSGLYRSVLAGKRSLILLDNASSTEQVEPLLPPAGCYVLITSRVKFTLPGMAEKDLGILPAEEARQLLLEIAPRIGPRADELANLCGYLPLALRNAGRALAEKKDLKVSEYEQRLKDIFARLELVKGSFSLSYDLLSPARKKQWSRLSVFPDDFDRNAATAVLKMSPVASADALSDLVRWSLVDFVFKAGSEDGRYRLHDLARLFAESNLQGADLADAKLRHATHFLKILSKAGRLYRQGCKKDLLEGLSLFDQELANIKVGHSWIKSAIHSHRLLNKNDLKSIIRLASSYANDGIEVINLRLHPREQIAWLETGLMASRIKKDRKAEGAHLVNLGLAYSDLGETHNAIEFYQQALIISHEIGDRRGEGNALGNLGNAYSDLGETRKAIEFYQQALIIAHEIGDRRGEGADLGNLGNAYSDLGETHNAIEFYHQALIISKEIGDRRGEGNALSNLGSAYSDLGETRKAIEFYQQALVISHEIGDRRGEENALGNLGNAYSDLGETRKAIEFYQQALFISHEIDDRRGEGNALGNLGSAYSDLGETRKAFEFYQQALVISHEIGDMRSEGNALGNLGSVYSDLGETRKAIEFYEQALKISQEIGDLRAEGDHLNNLGIAYSMLSEPRKAIEFYEQALKIAQEIGDRRGGYNALGNMGVAYSHLGKTRKAIEFYEQALKIAQEIGDRRGEGLLGNLGLAYSELGEPRKAIEFYEQALKIAQEIGDRRGEGTDLGNMGIAYSDLGELRKAIEFYEQALKIAQEIGDRLAEGNHLGNLGNAYSDLGEPRKAIEFYEQALKIAQEISDRMGEGNRLGNLGLAYSELGETHNAIEFYQQALIISREICDRRGEGNQLGNLGNAYSHLGEPRKAIEFHEQSLAIAKGIFDRQSESEILCNLGKAYLDIRETDRTIEYCTKSLDIARNIEYKKFEGEALCTLGKAFTTQDTLQKALDYCDQALKIFQDIEYPKGEAEALFARSQALHQLGQHEEAVSSAQQALAIFQRIESPLAEKVRQQLADWGSPQEN